MPNPALPTTNEHFNRFNNVYAQYLFANEEQKEFFIDLLNAVLAERQSAYALEKITDVAFSGHEVVVHRIDEDDDRIGLCVARTEEQIIDLEVQCTEDKSIVDRDLFFFSNILSTQNGPDTTFEQAKPVLIVTLLKENHFPNKPDDYITAFGMCENISHEPLIDRPFIIHVEADKCVQLGDPTHSRLTQWMTYLRSTSDEAIQKLAQGDELFKKVLEAERKFRGDAAMMNTYSNIERLENENALLESKNDELESKIAELESKIAELERKKAELESEQASLKQEVARAKLEEALKNAKNMLAKGLPRSLVKEITELSDSQLAALS